MLCLKLGDKLVAVESLEGMACTAVARAESERAARLFGTARGLREALGYEQAPRARALREPHLTAARSRIDEAVWEEAFAEGQSMGLEEAVAYALSEKVSFATPPSSATGQPSLLFMPDRPAGLTSREVEVLELAATGLTSAQIANELFLSPRTVETHLTSIYHKLGVTSRSAATRFALEHGLT